MKLIGQVRAIRVLCEIAEQGSFSAAARSLGMTQSAVSQHVAALERETGLPLVDRGTRPVQLTEAGAVLVRHGRQSLPSWTTPSRRWPRSAAAGPAGCASAASRPR